MKTLNEKILNAANGNSLWAAGGPASSFKRTGDGKYEFDGIQALAAASVQNPLFFSNNLEYVSSYAAGPGSMVGLVRVKELRSLNLLDLTSEEEMSKLFPECADSALFAELFRKGEPYYTFNWGKMVNGRQNLRPASFMIARLLIIFRHLGREEFVKSFKAYGDECVSYGGRFKKRGETKPVACYYPALTPTQISRWGLDRIILDESFKDEEIYSGDVTDGEYTELYNAYCEAAFKPCIDMNGDGELVKDGNGRYVLVRCRDFPNLFGKNVRNPDRPVSRDASVGLGARNGGKMTRKAVQWAMPAELDGECARHVNLYMKLTRQMRNWYRAAAEASGETLARAFDRIAGIVSNDNGSKGANRRAVLDGTYSHGAGGAASCIDNLQYMFYYIVQRHAGGYDGCWAPEVIGTAYRGIKSGDHTILLWNADGVEVVDCVEGSRVKELVGRLRAARENGGPLSDLAGRTRQDDASLGRLFALAKETPPSEEPEKAARRKKPRNEQPVGVFGFRRGPSSREQNIEIAKDALATLNTSRYSYDQKLEQLDALYNSLRIWRKRDKSLAKRDEELDSLLAKVQKKRRTMRKSAPTGAMQSVAEIIRRNCSHSDKRDSLRYKWANLRTAAERYRNSAYYKKGSDREKVMTAAMEMCSQYARLETMWMHVEDLAELTKALENFRLKRGSDRSEAEKMIEKTRKIIAGVRENAAELQNPGNGQYTLIEKNKFAELLRALAAGEKKAEEAVSAASKRISDYSPVERYRNMLDKIKASSGLSGDEKLEQLINLHGRVKSAKSSYLRKGRDELAEKLGAFMTGELAKSIELAGQEKKKKKKKKGTKTVSESEKTRIFDCPKFGVDAVETGDGRVAYLLDDDEYALAVVRDADADMYLMARQYRFGAGRCMLEFVGGGVEPGESPAEAVVREIREETGVLADPSDVVALSRTTMNPSVSGSRLYLFYVEVDSAVRTARADGHELVDPVWLTYDQVSRFMMHGDTSTPSKLLWSEYVQGVFPDGAGLIGEECGGDEDGPVVFCDIDGVLIRNDENDLEDPEDYGYDDGMMERLLAFVRETGAKVVVTSTWRNTPDDGTEEYFGIDWPNPLPAVREALGDAYAGDAPAGPDKADAVSRWIYDNSYSGRFVIVDDELDDFAGTGLEKNLVLTDPVLGFTDEVAAAARSKLSK